MRMLFPCPAVAGVLGRNGMLPRSVGCAVAQQFCMLLREPTSRAGSARAALPPRVTGFHPARESHVWRRANECCLWACNAVG